MTIDPCPHCVGGGARAFVRGYAGSTQRQQNMCIDMCMDMCMDMCTGMCIDMCMDMCTGMCIDMCMDTWIEMCAVWALGLLSGDMPWQSLLF